jgi:hypothetical protein
LDAYRDLVALRASTGALRSARYSTVYADGQVHVSLRGDGPEAVYVLVNAGTETVAVPLEAAGTLLWGEAVVQGGTIKLAPRRGAVLSSS